MRFSPVCDFLARQLNTNISLYSDQARRIQTWCSRPDFCDLLIEDEAIRSFLTAPAPETFPILYTVNHTIAYARFPAESGFFLAGPVTLTEITPSAFPRMAHTLEKKLSPQLSSLCLAECTATSFLRAVLLLYNIFQEQDLDIFEVFRLNFHTELAKDRIHRQVTSTLFENREHMKIHNPYSQEMRLMQAIETGNIKQLKASWQETYPGELGTTSKDPFRNGKNLAQYVISASARAAIRGGLQPELVFTLTDSYSQQVDELTDFSILETLVTDVELQLTEMVRDAREHSRNKNQENIPVVETCKQYIFSHLHSRLTVQEIADEVKIHPSYLSTLFKKQEGISIYKYIMLQKIDLVKNLLTYSDYSFLEIASYLGFVSQSHLGKQFKTVTGMTLKEYRDKYHKEEFSI